MDWESLDLCVGQVGEKLDSEANRANVNQGYISELENRTKAGAVQNAVKTFSDAGCPGGVVAVKSIFDGRLIMSARLLAGSAIISLFLACTNSAGATGTYCAVTERTDDGYVSLRSGPSARYPAIAQLLPSDYLWIDTGECRDTHGSLLCDHSKKWVFVERLFALNGNTSPSQTTGWVNSRFIRVVACSD